MTWNSILFTAIMAWKPVDYLEALTIVKFLCIFMVQS